MTPTSKRNILIVTLILAVVTIPLHNNLNSLALIVFCITAAFQQPVQISIERLKKDNYWKLGTVFCLWMACTWFWDNSGGFTTKELELNASFIFLPLVMTVMPKLTPKELMTVCFSFIGAVIIVCLICLTKSYIEYQHTQDSRVFFYHYLGYQMNLNAIYLSNYCIASIAWLLYYRYLYRGPRYFRPGTVLTLSACIFLF